MIISNVYPILTAIKPLNNQQKYNAKDLKHNKQNSNVLQNYLNFKGTINKATIDSSFEIGESILKNYRAKMKHIDFPDFTILHNLVDFGQVCILFKKQMKLDKVFSYFSKNMEKIAKTVDGLENIYQGHIKEHFNNETLSVFSSAIKKGDIPNLNIKGLMGYGSFSSAFLTSDNKILKLSECPIYPKDKNFIKGVDVPMYAKYASHMDKKNVYGLLEAFTEVANIKLLNDDLAESKFNQAWDKLNQELKSKTDYDFTLDFNKSQSSMRQMGFIGDTPYLIDTECVMGRPLVRKATRT